ncbi:alpha/beta fold hydrolase [Limnochorda pilosa]|uniref:Alpha/beta hydrolase n=1 Tax=Limnochorda pilosa TaxID=1555112 RepID=A0A0K2SIT5_LIMPI|nr:alpha/beta hydrolase [Limnochorda pilosa]BAS26937.1 alpha/beta hydrolase [Limnochorda pilosa]
MRATAGGVTLHYTEVGEGVPVLAPHGAPGLLDHTYLRQALEPLGLPIHWVLWDHRGSGRSEEGLLEAISHRQLVDDMESLRESLNLGQPVLFGHSYGGFFALEHALRCPGRASALILCNTAPSYRFFDEYLANVRRHVPQDAWSRLTDAALEGPQPALAGELARVFGALLFARTDVERARRLVEGSLPHPAVSRRLARETMRQYDLEPRLHEVRCPTLVLGGRHDRVCAPRFAEVMAAAIPGAKLVLFEGSGHMPMVEEPDRFAHAVRAFLDEHRLLD